MSQLAVVDIGTNSIHMVLAEIRPDFTYTVVDRLKDMTRLGDGAFTTHRLSEQAMCRGLTVIRNLTTLARNKGCDHMVAAATSAVREAKNGGDFLKEVFQETGLRVRVVTGQEEARLIYLGVRHSMELSEQPSLIVDVGGGSVEVIACTNTRMLYGKSLKLGAIRLKDLYVKEDPPKKAMMQAAESRITHEIGTVLKKGKIGTFDHVIATSGMATNLAEIASLRRTGYSLSQVNLATLTYEEISGMECLLRKLDLPSRKTIPGIDERRVDTLCLATMVYRIVMEQAGHQTLTISDKAIREGLIYDFIERHMEGIRAEQEIPNLRRRHVMLLARRCRYPETHSHHVAQLAMTLFDQTQAIHQLGAREREWLEFAAVLHDIGYVINAHEHHKHSYYLIKHGDLVGLTAEEIEVIANVARYHRRAVPQTKHAPFKLLPTFLRRTVEILSGFLRLADGLDRSHFSIVRSLHLICEPTMLLHLQCTGDAALEVWAAQSRADVFENVFRRPVQLITHIQNGTFQ